MKIYAFGQPEAEMRKPTENEVLISIATPKWVDTDYPVPNLANWRNNPVLQLAFHDSDPKQFDGKLLRHMSLADAYAILDFVQLHMGKDVVIHCWRGVSRSPTIARALAVICSPSANYTVAGSQTPWQQNNHVRAMIWQAAQERKEERAVLNGFKAYLLRDDLHEEEKGMSSQMYEAGWADAKQYFGHGKRFGN